jgi:hypothetical protein
MIDVAATKNAEGSTPDRTPSTPDVAEVAPTDEVALAAIDDGGPEHSPDSDAEYLGELRVGPTFVAVCGTYYNVDRIESISVDQDGRTLMSLIGVDRAIVLEVSIDELLDTLGIDA